MQLRQIADALTHARTLDSEWSQLPTIGLQSLVDLKKTQRLEDYPIISKLAVAWFDQPECAKAAEDFAWAADNGYIQWLFIEKVIGTGNMLTRNRP